MLHLRYIKSKIIFSLIAILSFLFKLMLFMFLKVLEKRTKSTSLKQNDIWQLLMEHLSRNSALYEQILECNSRNLSTVINFYVFVHGNIDINIKIL